MQGDRTANVCAHEYTIPADETKLPGGFHGEGYHPESLPGFPVILKF